MGRRKLQPVRVAFLVWCCPLLGYCESRCQVGPKVKVKVKSKFIKCHKNYTISTGTEALARLRLAISVRNSKQMRLELAAES